jgi:GAF domain-containing protein
MPLSAENDVTQVLHERRVFHLADIEHNPATTPEHIENARLGGYRTRLMVPMVRGDSAVGLIAVTHQAPTPFPDQQVALLKIFADQAVIAIENVRLFTELGARNRDVTEALQRQTATADILRVISRSPTDTTPVFDVILENATRLCDAHLGLLGLVENGIYRTVADQGASPEFRTWLRSEAADTDTRTLASKGAVSGVARMIVERQPVHILDLASEPAYLERHPGRVATVEIGGARTFLAVPMFRENELVGGIVVYRPDVRAFTHEQIAVIQTFAAQAVIAIENVRLFKELGARNAELTEALEQQTATSEILRVISSSPTDLQPVLDAVVKSAARFCGAYDAQMWHLKGESLRLAAHHGPIPSPVGWLLPVARDSVTGRSVLEGRAVHVADLEAETEEFPEGSALARELGYRTILSVPLLREGVPLGAIILRRTAVEPFSDKQIELLKTFADQAVIAIENVRLFTELQGKNWALTQAHGQVSEALEQQTATSDILRVISQSPTDVQPVFDIIAQRAVSLCNAEVSVVSRFDGSLLQLAALHGVTRQGVEALRAVFPMRLDAETMTSRAFRGRVVVHEEDVLADARYQVKAGGWRGGLAVPMLRGTEVIGVIFVGRSTAGLFSGSQVELLRTFADQAVIAIENVRLFKELEARNHDLTEALEQQTATSEILQVISASPTDVQPVFDAIATAATALCAAENAGVFLYDGTLIHFAAHHNWTVKDLDAIRQVFPRPPGPGTVTARAILTRAVAHTVDVAADPGYEIRGFVDEGFHAILSVPMLREGDPMGAISVTRRESVGFTDRQIALLQTFADQAVIAIENVRLFKELQARNRELTIALEQQTATGEILRVISGAQTDAQPVFDTIVQSAVRLCEARSAVVFRLVDDTLHLVAHDNMSPEWIERARQGYPQRLSRDHAGGLAILERQIVHVPDIEADGRFPHAQELARTMGYRSLVFVPMLHEGAPIGAIALTSNEPFTANQIALLRTFADQAVIAIENVRLFKELEARTGELTESVDQLTALGEVSRAVSSTLDVETVLDTIVSRASQLAGAAGCSIYEYDEAAEQFELRATHNADTEFVTALRAVPLRKGEGLMGRAAEMREPIQIPDITQPGAYQSSVRDTLIRFGYRALLAVPLLREDQIIGSLSFNRKAPGEFPPEVVDVLKTFATQSALAIQNARLFREIADKSAQLEAASRHKSEFLANMSHELRTPLNAIIGFSEVLTERMFGELNEKQDEYLKDIHASGQHLLSLINDILDLSKIEAGRMELERSDFDLPNAIENALILVRERASRRGIRLGHTIDERLGAIGGDERKVKQVLLNLLSNALKFTPEGGQVDVRAGLNNDVAEVSVTDTGIGIAPEDQEAVFEEFRQVGAADKKSEGTGLGLALSRKFIELHGGRIWVKSQVGAGSTFTFTLPMRREE